MARFIKGASLIIGGVVVGTVGLVLGAALWRQGIGPVLACLFVAAGICMADRGMASW